MIGYGDNSVETWTAATLVRYPHIACATMAMAYDNGCINRDCSEEQLVERLVAWMKKPDVCRYSFSSERWLDQCERLLSELSFEDMTDLCCGEDEDGLRVLHTLGQQRDGPLDALLMNIFEEVLG